MRLPGALAALSALSVRVCTPAWELEFPVRHLNWGPDGRYQIETGPVLVAEDGAGDVLQRLRRAWLIMNRPGEAHFLLDTPRRAAPGGRWARRLRLACESELLQVAP